MRVLDESGLATLVKHIKDALFRHKTRIDILEKRVTDLESKVNTLDSEDPWKMPFD